MCNKSNPCVAPLPSSNGVENNASLRYNYIADESSPSSDPYGIGVEEGNNMLPLPINVSSDIPLLTRPKKRFKNNNNNNIVHKPFSSSGYGFSMVTNILEPHSREVAAATMEPDNTSNVNVAITVAPPPPVPENEEEVELEDLPLPFPYPEAEQGANGIPFETSTILVKRNKNIIRKLVKFAQKQGFFILGANGTVSLVELLNDEDAPVAKTTLQGTFEIILLDGNIIIPKNNSEVSWLTILMAGKDSRIKGGLVKRLLAGSNVQIVVAPLSAIDAESMARQQYLRRPELVHFPNYRHRDWLTKEVVNRIHKATLKELNNEITNTLA
ncbi:PREDICTED: uncharacterized protein LOC109330792 [Lupinus angustifolius]|uniref:uncharacterized protein LOC109330792 n=1 Tax=Lupinus angustifolius TaxID=3871 RepID=UPI00092E401F|nr:PREDICTED: uncharacterized protein LOC109330792 [Lupinus angustifolius]